MSAAVLLLYLNRVIACSADTPLGTRRRLPNIDALVEFIIQHLSVGTGSTYESIAVTGVIGTLDLGTAPCSQRHRGY